jgi:hypothetical protein
MDFLVHMEISGDLGTEEQESPLRNQEAECARQLGAVAFFAAYGAYRDAALTGASGPRPRLTNSTKRCRLYRRFLISPSPLIRSLRIPTIADEN